MRRVLLLASSLAVLMLACQPALKPGECKTSDNCKDQVGYGKVCVQGLCQECGQDTDCKSGFVCRANKCVPRPECEKDSDCAAGKTCEAGRCVAAAPKPECAADADCGPGKACEGGTCVTRAPVSACPSDGKYEAINFDFDKSLIRPDDAKILEKDAACIKEQQPKRVTVAGHCDERGTAEYNLALGERRVDDLFALVRGAAPYASLSRASFEGTLDMLAGRYPSDEFAELRRMGINPLP